MFLAVTAGSLQYYLGELKSVTDLGAFFLPTVGDIEADKKNSVRLSLLAAL